jgi:hypothetical protein
MTLNSNDVGPCMYTMCACMYINQYGLPAGGKMLLRMVTVCQQVETFATLCTARYCKIQHTHTAYCHWHLIVRHIQSHTVSQEKDNWTHIHRGTYR